MPARSKPGLDQQGAPVKLVVSCRQPCITIKYSAPAVPASYGQSTVSVCEAAKHHKHGWIAAQDGPEQQVL